MARHKDLILDDYIEDDYDYEIDYDYGKDSSDFIEDYEEEKYANYESKSTVNDDSKVETTKKKETKEIYLSETVSTIIDTISSFSNMFGIFGIIIAIVLILIFIVTLQFKSLALYLITLIGSFFFGYGFMYLLDRFTSNN